MHFTLLRCLSINTALKTREKPNTKHLKVWDFKVQCVKKCLRQEENTDMNYASHTQRKIIIDNL